MEIYQHCWALPNVTDYFINSPQVFIGGRHYENPNNNYEGNGEVRVFTLTPTGSYTTSKMITYEITPANLIIDCRVQPRSPRLTSKDLYEFEILGIRGLYGYFKRRVLCENRYPYFARNLTRSVVFDQYLTYRRKNPRWLRDLIYYYINLLINAEDLNILGRSIEVNRLNISLRLNDHQVGTLTHPYLQIINRETERLHDLLCQEVDRFI